MRDILRPAFARPAFVVVGLSTLGLGVAVPLAFTEISAVALPHQAGGSLVSAGGRIVGSSLLGQDFTSDRYFHSRPSATTEPDPNNPGSTRDRPYNGAASGASNLAPTSTTLLTAVQERIVQYGQALVPADAATASASGLDPHISPANAQRQVARVAAARQLATEQVARLVANYIEPRNLGLLGQPRINVLILNMALDELR